MRCNAAAWLKSYQICTDKITDAKLRHQCSAFWRFVEVICYGRKHWSKHACKLLQRWQFGRMGVSEIGVKYQAYGLRFAMDFVALLTKRL